jgi:hypothetical protein
VKRRRKELDLKGSGSTMRTIDPATAEQLVIDQMDKDPAKRSGVRTIQQKIAFENAIHLTRYLTTDTPIMFLMIHLIRDHVSAVMHTHDSDAFASREPTAKKVFRVKKYPIGIHHRWSADGHDKLYKIGFPIWAIIEDATAKWLGAWVVPSNRMGDIVAYLFLCVVEKYGGTCKLPFVRNHCADQSFQEYRYNLPLIAEQRRRKFLALLMLCGQDPKPRASF